MRRVLPAGERAAASDLSSHADRERELRRYTEHALDPEENGSWWIPALKLAAATSGLEQQHSSLAALSPQLLERVTAELMYAGGATIPWVSGRCERVPQARMPAALEQLGALQPGLLSEHEKEALDTRGFVNLGPILPQPQLEALRTRLGELFVAEANDAGIEAHQERGAPRLSDLANKGPEFDVCYQHPKVLAAFAHVMGTDFKVNSLNCRVPLRTQGRQDLHVDWGPDPQQPGQQRGADAIRSGEMRVMRADPFQTRCVSLGCVSNTTCRCVAQVTSSA